MSSVQPRIDGEREVAPTAPIGPAAPVGVELVNARELARVLAVSERTLYRLKSTGELPPPVVLGGSVRWRLDEIRQWISKGCPRPTKPK